MAETVNMPNFNLMTTTGWGKSLEGFCGVTEARFKEYFRASENTEKGKQFFLEGYVHKVLFHASPFPDGEGFSAVQARCYPSMKQGSYSVKTAFDTSGNISATCGCPTGLATVCHHIAALLYYLEAITILQLRVLPDEKASTDILCKWNQPGAGSVSGKPLAEIGFPKTKRPVECAHRENILVKISKPSNLYDPRALRHRQTDQKQKNVLFQTLKIVNPTCAFVTHYSDDISNDNISQQLPSLTFESNENCQNVCNTVSHDSTLDPNLGTTEKVSILSSDFQEKVDNFIVDKYPRMSKEQVSEIERKTLGQNLNKCWFLIRKEKLTASNFGVICKLSVQPSNLLKKLLYTTPFYSKATNHGKKNEDVARLAYSKFNESTRPVTVKECGLFIMEDNPFLGGSPDGLVEDNFLNCRGLLEIKCPYSKFGKSVAISCNDKLFCIKKDKDGNMSLKKNHNYYFQVQGCMAVTGFQWCDFFIWNGLEKDQQYCERIHFDKYFWEEKILPALKHFLKYAFVPELLLRRVKDNKILYEIESYTPYKKIVKTNLTR